MSLEDFIGYTHGADTRSELDDPRQIAESIKKVYQRVASILESDGTIENGYRLPNLLQLVFRGKTHLARLSYETSMTLLDEKGTTYPVMVKLMSHFNLISDTEKPVIEPDKKLLIKIDPTFTGGDMTRSLTFTLEKDSQKGSGYLEFGEGPHIKFLDLGDCKALGLLLDSIG